MYKKTVLFALVAICCEFSFVHSTMCFYCQSNLDPRCNFGKFEYRPELIVNCSYHTPDNLKGEQTPQKCSKVVKYVHGRKIVSRACYFETTQSSSLSDHCMRQIHENHTEYSVCEVCDTDLCNSAKGLHADMCFGTLSKLFFISLNMCFAKFLLL